MDEHGPQGLDRILLGEWFNDQNTKLSKACTDLLNDKDVYIAQESYQVTKGKYTLFGDTNFKVKLSNLNFGFFKIGGAAKAKNTSDGSVEFDAPVFTAIRRLKRTADGELRTLGTPAGEKIDDDEVRKKLASGR